MFISLNGLCYTVSVNGACAVCLRYSMDNCLRWLLVVWRMSLALSNIDSGCAPIDYAFQPNLTVYPSTSCGLDGP